MSEFLFEIVQPANLPATVLLALIVLYWLLVIFGVLSAEAFDFDMDIDADADVDADVDINGGGGITADALTFFHLGEVPVMILASFFVLFFWAITIFSNHYLNPTLSLLVTLYCLIPSLMISLLLTKLVIMPFVPLFRSMMVNKEDNLVGKHGVVSTSQLDGEFGQVTIEISGPPVVINGRTENAQRLLKNDAVRVIRFEPDREVYIVEPEKSENK